MRKEVMILIISFCMGLVLLHLVVILHCIYVHSLFYATSHQGHSLTYTARIGGDGEFATAVRDECSVYSGESRNLLRGDRRSRVFQHSLKVLVAYLVLWALDYLVHASTGAVALRRRHDLT